MHDSVDRRLMTGQVGQDRRNIPGRAPVFMVYERFDIGFEAGSVIRTLRLRKPIPKVGLKAR